LCAITCIHRFTSRCVLSTSTAFLSWKLDTIARPYRVGQTGWPDGPPPTRTVTFNTLLNPNLNPTNWSRGYIIAVFVYRLLGCIDRWVREGAYCVLAGRMRTAKSYLWLIQFKTKMR